MRKLKVQKSIAKEKTNATTNICIFSKKTIRKPPMHRDNLLLTSREYRPSGGANVSAGLKPVNSKTALHVGCDSFQFSFPFPARLHLKLNN